MCGCVSAFPRRKPDEDTAADEGQETKQRGAQPGCGLKNILCIIVKRYRKKRRPDLTDTARRASAVSPLVISHHTVSRNNTLTAQTAPSPTSPSNSSSTTPTLQSPPSSPPNSPHPNSHEHTARSKNPSPRPPSLQATSPAPPAAPACPSQTA